MREKHQEDKRRAGHDPPGQVRQPLEALRVEDGRESPDGVKVGVYEVPILPGLEWDDAEDRDEAVEGDHQAPYHLDDAEHQEADVARGAG